MSDAEQPEAQTDEGVPQTLVGISFPDIFRAQEFMTALRPQDQLALVKRVMPSVVTVRGVGYRLVEEER